MFQLFASDKSSDFAPEGATRDLRNLDARLAVLTPSASARRHMFDRVQALVEHFAVWAVDFHEEMTSADIDEVIQRDCLFDWAQIWRATGDPFFDFTALQPRIADIDRILLASIRKAPPGHFAWMGDVRPFSFASDYRRWWWYSDAILVNQYYGLLPGDALYGVY